MAQADELAAPSSLAVSRALLATSTGKQKLALILDAPDPGAFVRRLPAEDLYFALREIGLNDAVDVVALASPEQFQAFVDLDAWEGPYPSPERILGWLRLSRVGADTLEAYREQRRGLDPEAVLLILHTQTRVHFLEENDEPVLESQDYLSTPDHKYIVEITSDGDVERATVRLLLEELIDESPFEATRLFEAVRWEQRSELEETLLRWHTGRLRDLGFPEIDEAMQIWQPLPGHWRPRERKATAGPIAGVPAILLAGRGRALLLDRVSERLDEEGRATFNEGLLYLLNCALVCDGIAPRELDRARPSIESARDMLSLGLELASGGDEELALRILGTTPAVELFRRAATESLLLSRRAAQVVRLLGAPSLLDSPDAELVAGLRRKRPRLHLPEAPEGRAFQSRSDLSLAEQGLGRAEAAAALLDTLGVLKALPALADASGRSTNAVTVSQVLLTALVRALLGERGPLQPLPPALLSELGRFFQGEEGRLLPESAQAVAQTLDSLGARLAPEHRAGFDALAAEWTTRLEEEIGRPAVAGPLDARYVDCLLIAAHEDPTR